MDPPSGCSDCLGAPAQAMYARLREFTKLARLVDESHFIVRVVACPRCRQNYVTAFVEEIDWADGDDPQYRWIVPVSREESVDLVSRGGAVDLALIESLAHTRRHLRTSWPKGLEQLVYWAGGSREG